MVITVVIFVCSQQMDSLFFYINLTPCSIRTRTATSADDNFRTNPRLQTQKITYHCNIFRTPLKYRFTVSHLPGLWCHRLSNSFDL